MGVYTERQLVVVCDTCGDMDTNGGQGRRYSLRVFRGDGWTVGKKTTCPECNKKQHRAERTAKSWTE